MGCRKAPRRKRPRASARGINDRREAPPRCRRPNPRHARCWRNGVEAVGARSTAADSPTLLPLRPPDVLRHTHRHPRLDPASPLRPQFRAANRRRPPRSPVFTLTSDPVAVTSSPANSSPSSVPLGDRARRPGVTSGLLHPAADDPAHSSRARREPRTAPRPCSGGRRETTHSKGKRWSGREKRVSFVDLLILFWVGKRRPRLSAPGAFSPRAQIRNSPRAAL